MVKVCKMRTVLHCGLGLLMFYIRTRIANVPLDCLSSIVFAGVDVGIVILLSGRIFKTCQHSFVQDGRCRRVEQVIETEALSADVV